MTIKILFYLKIAYKRSSCAHCTRAYNTFFSRINYLWSKQNFYSHHIGKSLKSYVTSDFGPSISAASEANIYMKTLQKATLAWYNQPMPDDTKPTTPPVARFVHMQNSPNELKQGARKHIRVKKRRKQITKKAVSVARGLANAPDAEAIAVAKEHGMEIVTGRELAHELSTTGKIEGQIIKGGTDTPEDKPAVRSFAHIVASEDATHARSMMESGAQEPRSKRVQSVIDAMADNPNAKPARLPTTYADVLAAAREVSVAAIGRLNYLAHHAKAENVRLQAAVAILDRAWGKPHQAIAVAQIKAHPTMPIGPESLSAGDLRELRQIVARASLAADAGNDALGDQRKFSGVLDAFGSDLDDISQSGVTIDVTPGSQDE